MIAFPDGIPRVLTIEFFHPLAAGIARITGPF